MMSQQNWRRNGRMLGTAAALAGVCAGAFAAAPTPPAKASMASVDPDAMETKAERDKRMGWWRDARFGMFIHWGLYAVPAGAYDGKEVKGLGEWIMNRGKIPVADYAAFAKQFNPTDFNADEWVGIAKSAGMKYIVMTAKHHDGFAMFHSLADPFNIYDATPFKRDPIAEMAAACKKQGVKFGVYYSQAQDWHHAGGAAYGGHWDPAQDGDLHTYIQKVAAPQLKELLTRYHPAVLWWDTPVPMTPEDIRALTAGFPEDPGLIANNRLGNGVPGDTETPEQRIPATGYPGDWETCMTINDTWGYKSNDTNFKPVAMLLHNLIDIASKGGNYLLNVGPTDKGIIPGPEVERLGAVGAWMKVNGDAIYKTSASPFKRLPFNGRATRRGDHLYLHVFQWPDGGLSLPGLQTPVRDARALASGEKLTVERSADGTVTISKPKVIDPLATVIDLRLSGEPVVVEAPVTIKPNADGSFRFTATDARIQGATAKVENTGGTDNIGFWTDPKDVAAWTVTVPPSGAGAYRVEVEYACEPGADGAAYTVQVAGDPGKGATGIVLPTKGWMNYAIAQLDGTVTLSPGVQELKIVPGAMPHIAVMNLRRITLIPVVK
jgi:alpha-L-fucosidase